MGFERLLSWRKLKYTLGEEASGTWGSDFLGFTFSISP
jgi:hypothetical protein